MGWLGDVWDAIIGNTDDPEGAPSVPKNQQELQDTELQKLYDQLDLNELLAPLMLEEYGYKLERQTGYSPATQERMDALMGEMAGLQKYYKDIEEGRKNLQQWSGSEDYKSWEATQREIDTLQKQGVPAGDARLTELTQKQEPYNAKLEEYRKKDELLNQWPKSSEWTRMQEVQREWDKLKDRQSYYTLTKQDQEKSSAQIAEETARNQSLIMMGIDPTTGQPFASEQDQMAAMTPSQRAEYGGQRTQQDQTLTMMGIDPKTGQPFASEEAKLAALTPLQRAEYEQETQQRNQSLVMMGIDPNTGQAFQPVTDETGKVVKTAEDAMLAAMAPALRNEYEAEKAQRAAESAGLKQDEQLYNQQLIALGIDPKTGEPFATEAHLLAALSPSQRRDYEVNKAAQDREKVFYDRQLASWGYNPSGEKMTDEQWQATLNPRELADYQTERELQDRQLKALRGELPVDPALERGIQEEMTGAKEGLSRKLGSNWELSTPGIQQMTKLKESAEALRYNARHGVIQEGESALAARRTMREATGSPYSGTSSPTASGRSVSLTGRTTPASGLTGRTMASMLLTGATTPEAGSNLAGNIQSQRQSRASGLSGFTSSPNYVAAMQPYQAQTNLTYDWNTQRGQQSAANQSGLMSLLGTLIGSGAAYFSSRDAKKGIDKLSSSEEDILLEKMLGSDVYSYKYKNEGPETKKHIGMVTEEAPDEFVTSDKKHMDIVSHLGGLTAAARSLGRRVKLLEARGGAK